MFKTATAICATALVCAPAFAATPRQILTNAAFTTRDKGAALAQIGQAEAAARAVLMRSPGDREASLMRAMSIGYRAKLTRSRADAVEAHKQFEALAASGPRDPEAQILLGGWHIDAITELGGFVAGAGLGARKGVGLAAIDRSVALGGSRAAFAGLAALLRLSLDPDDARGRQLAELASRGGVVSPLDQVMQRAATAILTSIRAGNDRQIQQIAKLSLPFGRVAR